MVTKYSYGKTSIQKDDDEQRISFSYSPEQVKRIIDLEVNKYQQKISREISVLLDPPFKFLHDDKAHTKEALLVFLTEHQCYVAEGGFDEGMRVGMKQIFDQLEEALYLDEEELAKFNIIKGGYRLK